ncbi:response regulator transcription factor [Georgenia sp. EYE_87]|uniref:helix-turn-helix transcriptional regulator n=1 Tax=Georgenia sp. EYE_87 TaxID=2853448 RepID=UPI0020038D55|nr:response regulator transcription factor [Georgenia sp. EYE_87]MCK6209116.1 response regulator transcription factor [Georgenia sp. EYE_87]
MRVEQLDRGRRAYARREWSQAYASIVAAGTETTLPAEDLFRLATSAMLLGRDDEADDLLAAAFRVFLDGARPDRAARCAFWAGMSLLNRGQAARGAGWLARAQRLVDAGAGEVERAYLSVAVARQAMLTAGAGAGAGDDAGELAAAALETGERAGDHDLTALARVTLGTWDVMCGRTARGLATLDEAMVDVTTGGVSAVPAGIAYCAVIEICTASMDLPRAREWTTALTRWCDSQPDLVLFRGQCLVNRARLMRLRGSWDAAVAEAGRAVTRLSDPAGQPGAGEAWYELGEVLRLRGELDEAETAYRSADEHGFEPQPGLALLRLSQGRTEDAAAAVRRVRAEAGSRAAVPLLAAAVEVLLAAGDLDGARRAAAELAPARPGTGGVPTALADRAAGEVLLAEGRARPALEPLRRAWAAWVRLDVPYEIARTRVLLARAGCAVGDEDGARLELESACRAFERLGAAPDLAAARADLGRLAPGVARLVGLTDREVEVLRLVATGRTNRAIAAELFLSERTVARHLSNIFDKLDLPSRAAATAYAYEHGLVRA